MNILLEPMFDLEVAPDAARHTPYLGYVGGLFSALGSGLAVGWWRFLLQE